MSEHMGDTASSASERPERGENILTLTTARSMLPLVKRIVQDVLLIQRGLAQLHPEQDRLQRQRRSLAWPERARRYRIQEELAALEQSRQQAVAEIEGLGVKLLDPETGRVGFPTLVNDKRAFFSWKSGEDDINHWHFAGETVLRSIPLSWNPIEATVRGKR